MKFKTILMLAMCLMLLPFNFVAADDHENRVFVSISRVDQVSDVSVGLTKEVATIFSFVEVQALLHGNWTEDGYVGVAFLFIKPIGPLHIGAILGLEIDAQLVDPNWSLLDKLEAYSSKGVSTIGGVVGFDISKQIGWPLSLNAIWYEKQALQSDNTYRKSSSFYANISFGFNGLI